jgi:hypothetical protein
MIQMIDSSKCVAVICAATAAAIFATASSAFSQAPTDAQRSAIRAQCRSDYEAHCASVPPGGMASLQCLQKNMSSLSPGCQSAVRAVEAPVESKSEPSPAAAPEKAESEPAAAPKAEPAPPNPPAEGATAPPKAAANPPAKKPSSAQIGAIRSACRADYPKVCAGVPTGGAAALQCLATNKAKLSANCERAVAAASGGAATTASGTSSGTGTAAAAPAAAPPPVLVLRPMLPREQLFVLRSACGADVRALCAGVAPGGGRIIQCLVVQSASLSPDCRGVLSEFAAQ